MMFSSSVQCPLTSTEAFNVPEELSNELLAHLIERKLLTKANLNLVLRSSTNDSYSLIKSLILNQYVSLSEDAIQQIAIASGLEVLSLRGCSRVSDETIEKLAQGCIALRSLDISRLPKITNRSIEVITTNLKQLETLIMEQCILISGSVQIKNESLRTLKLGGSCSLATLSIFCPLESLDVSDSTKLETIEWNTKPSLKILNLFRCINFADASVIHLLSKVVNLVKLNLFECDKIQSGTIAKGIIGCRELQEVILSNIEKISNQDIIALADHCPNLTTLFLNSCPSITDEGVIALADKCTTKLEVIGLPPSISDNSIVRIAQQCTQLRSIDVGVNRHVTSTSIRTILANSMQLFSLAVPVCRLITDDAFVGYTRESNPLSKTLQNLNLFNVPIGDASLKSIAQNFPQLSALDLFRNTRITDDGLLAIIDACGNTLKRLYLQMCTLITDRVVEAIAKKCPVLEYLDLYSCNLITIESIKELLQKTENLKELNLHNRLRDETNEFRRTNHIPLKTKIICSRAAEL